MCFSYYVQIQVTTLSNAGGNSPWDIAQPIDPEVEPGGAEQRPAATV